MEKTGELGERPGEVNGLMMDSNPSLCSMKYPVSCICVQHDFMHFLKSVPTKEPTSKSGSKSWLPTCQVVTDCLVSSIYRFSLYVPTMCTADFCLCLSVMGSAGVTDGVSQSADEKALWRSAGRSNQQTHAAHQRQTAAPQNVRRAVEPAEAGAQQGVWLTRAHARAHTHSHTHSRTHTSITSKYIIHTGLYSAFEDLNPNNDLLGLKQ